MEPIESSYYYHIFNRGNNKQAIFFDKENYIYFLKLVKKYLVPICKIYSYCLLKNHFHMCVRIHDDVEKPHQNFSNLFNAYTKAINKRYKRTGSLFQRTVKRKIIAEDAYLRDLTVYIHLNPETHGMVGNFATYPHSSYKTFFSEKPTNIEREEVIEWFDDLKNFEFVHKHRKMLNEEKLEEILFD